jgi:hypothetical protein
MGSKIFWHRVAVGLYTSDLGSVIREFDGWCFFRLTPRIVETGFSSYDSAKRWAESNVARAG